MKDSYTLHVKKHIEEVREGDKIQAEHYTL
jgi:hypothetical protein